MERMDDQLDFWIHNYPGIVYQCKYDEYWTITKVSEEIKDLTGYPASDFIHNAVRSFESIISKEDSKRIRKQIDKAIASRKPWSVEYRLKRKDGKFRWIHENGKAVTNERGETEFLFGFLYDITHRKRTEEKLQQTEKDLRKKEQFLASIVEAQQDLICRFLPDTTLTFVNKHYCKAFGLQEEQLLGRKFLDFIPEEQHTVILEKLAGLGPDNPVQTYERQSFRQDGTPVWHQWIDSVILDLRGNVIELQSTGRDVTAQKRMEEMIIENNELLRVASENLDGIIYTLNRDLNITLSKGKILSDVGLKDDELVGKTLYDYYFTRDQNHPMIAAHLRALEGETVRLETTINNLDFQINISPIKNQNDEIIGVLGLTLDITDRKKMIEALKESEDLLAETQKIAGVGSWVLIPDTNKLTWSAETYRIYGINPKEMDATYETYLNVIHPDDLQMVLDAYFNSLMKGQDTYSIQHRIIQKNIGAIRHVYEKGVHHRNEKGRIYKTVGMVQDITESKEKEDQIQRNLKEKVTLLSEIHHRVKNNLAIISSLVDLQQEFEISDKDPLMLLKGTKSRISSMAVVHEIVYENDNFAEIDFAKLLQKLIANIENIFKNENQEVSIREDIHPVYLTLEVSVPLSLLANELISNSYKHAFSDQKAGEITVCFKKEKSGYFFKIKDNGRGVSDVESLKDSDSMGMTIINGLVQQLRGEIEFKQDGGLSAGIWIPEKTLT